MLIVAVWTLYLTQVFGCFLHFSLNNTNFSLLVIFFLSKATAADAFCLGPMTIVVMAVIAIVMMTGIAIVMMAVIAVVMMVAMVHSMTVMPALSLS